MTDPGIDTTTHGESAATLEDIAAGWVVDRCNQEDWTPERQEGLDAWLGQSISHRVAYVRVAAGWRRTERLVALRAPMRVTLESRAPGNILWVRVAAVLGLVAITTIPAAHYFTQPKTQLIETPKGGQERLTLADGSQIELNTDSAVRIDLNSHARAVQLVRGEVLFQIKHDPEHPFVVTAANRRIIDLGTKFIVRANSKNLEVSLLEGKVRLESTKESGASRATDLLPGDIATVTAEAIRVSKVSERNLEDRLAWRRGSIVFHNASLTEVVAEFNRYGGSQLALANSDDGKLRITGAFRITGSEAFAANAHELFGLKIERRNGVIVLSR